MNPHAPQRKSPAFLVSTLWNHRQLLVKMTWRDIAGRYRGSIMGLLWSFANPIFMLAVYTFVFSVVFEAKWGGSGSEGKTEFALILFVGLIMHNLLAEVLNRAPALIPSNANYVKKVVFPLEILPVISVGTALFHSTISLFVLLSAFAVLNGHLHWTLLFTPLVVLPLAILVTGVAWILASLGVFIRDLSQATGIFVTVLLFVSPIFFPISAIPKAFQAYVMFNPLTFIIEQARAILIFGNSPDWAGLGIYTLVALLIAWCGFAWFQKTRKGFADVI